MRFGISIPNFATPDRLLEVAQATDAGGRDGVAPIFVDDVDFRPVTPEEVAGIVAGIRDQAVCRSVPAMHDSVTVHMAAAPEKIWDLLSDVTRIGELSPETFEGEWLDGATGPAAGVRFRGHVRRNGRGPVYWTVCGVTECEPGRVFAFDVLGPGGRKVNSWRYDIEPDGHGARVTESYRLVDSPLTKLYELVAGRARNRTNVKGMQATLERAKAIVES